MSRKNKEKDDICTHAQNRKGVFMHNTQEIAQKIKDTAKQKNIKIKELLELSGIKNINAISELAKGQQLSCISLGNIANILDVSVDYLLGRTDDPHTIGEHSIQTGNIGDNNGNGDTSVKIYNAVQLDETTQQLVKAFQSLNFVEKSKVMGVVAELISK